LRIVVTTARDNKTQDFEGEPFKKFSKYVEYVGYCVPKIFSNGLSLQDPSSIFEFEIECPEIIDGMDFEAAIKLIERNHLTFEASPISKKWKALDVEYAQLKKIFEGK
jgi:hypothetical protein